MNYDRSFQEYVSEKELPKEFVIQTKGTFLDQRILTIFNGQLRDCLKTLFLPGEVETRK